MDDRKPKTLIKGAKFRALRTRRPGDEHPKKHQIRELVDPSVHPSLFIFPNLFTSASLFLSLFSIVKVSEAEFIAACWLILLAAVCDVIDGPVARFTRTSSSFGLQFDSLADIVAFGVAPAFLMFANLRQLDQSLLPSYAPKLALGACALYSICSAIRLARFNVQADTTERRYFRGLPTPGAAGMVVSSFLFVTWLEKFSFYQTAEDTRWLTLTMHRSILLLMVCLAILMVSEIPFPKLKNLVAVSRNHVQALVFIVGLVCLLITLQDYVPALLFAGFLIYILAAVFGHVRRKMRRRRTGELLEAGN